MRKTYGKCFHVTPKRQQTPEKNYGECSKITSKQTTETRAQKPYCDMYPFFWTASKRSRACQNVNIVTSLKRSVLNYIVKTWNYRRLTLLVGIIFVILSRTGRV